MKIRENISVVVLAGGRGKRTGSEYPKVIQKLNGKPTIFWVLDMLNNLGIKNIVVVTGYQANLVTETIRKAGYRVLYIRQKRQQGTADALKYGLVKIPKTTKSLLVLFGDDSALYSATTIKRFINFFYKSGGPVSVIATVRKTTSQIGGLKVDAHNNIVDIFSKSEIIDLNLKEHLVLCGAFCFKKPWLLRNIGRIEKNVGNGEYSLPKILILAAQQKKYAKFYLLKDSNQWNSVNTPTELKETQLKIKKKLR